MKELGRHVLFVVFKLSYALRIRYFYRLPNPCACGGTGFAAGTIANTLTQ